MKTILIHVNPRKLPEEETGMELEVACLRVWMVCAMRMAGVRRKTNEIYAKLSVLIRGK